jgi:predicted RNA-binding Zn ribbon-like protein
MTLIEFSRTKDSAALAVGLVNTWDTMARNPELLRDRLALRELLRFYIQEKLADRIVEGDVAPVRELRDRLRRAFEAVSEPEAVGVLNGILKEAGSVPQLESAGGSWNYRYHKPGAPAADVLAATTAIALLDVIRGDGWDRFGLCEASPCCCVYIDRSRNRSRRYCCQLCADRVSQATYRERKRGAGSR